LKNVFEVRAEPGGRIAVGRPPRPGQPLAPDAALNLGAWLCAHAIQYDPTVDAARAIRDVSRALGTIDRMEKRP
jgi:hypothetical protein